MSMCLSSIFISFSYRVLKWDSSEIINRGMFKLQYIVQKESGVSFRVYIHMRANTHISRCKLWNILSNNKGTISIRTHNQELYVL